MSPLPRFPFKRLLWLFLLISWLMNHPAAFAGDEAIPVAARIPYRIVRGVVNIGLGWTEILLRPLGEQKTEGIGHALSLGGAHTLMRLAAGATDITTCWVPDVQMLELYPDWQSWPYLFHWS